MTTKNEITTERIAQLADNITARLRESITSIQDVNNDIHVLSINAKILAAKAGASGKAFAVVADSVRGMVGRTQKITESLQTSVESTVGELTAINAFLGTKVRAERLSQVAVNMIDVIDRNLYERSCDVRWWATGSSVVTAAETPGADTARKCSERLGVILDSYTVYLDIVACGLDGHILANGRPDRFRCVGAYVGGESWYRAALESASGSDFGFQGLHKGVLAGGEPVLVYSCAIREGGALTGRTVGVLGVVFRWEGLGKVVVERAAAMLSAETSDAVEALIADEAGKIIASSQPRRIGTALDEGHLSALRSKSRGTLLPEEGTSGEIAGFAASAGFETYRTGWYALIAERGK